MVPIDTLSPDMKIKIVDVFTRKCYATLAMKQKYGGKTVTVRSVHSSDDVGLPYVRIYEDGGAWYWFADAIDYIVNDEEDQANIPPDWAFEDLCTMFGQEEFS